MGRNATNNQGQKSKDKEHPQQRRARNNTKYSTSKRRATHTEPPQERIHKHDWTSQIARTATAAGSDTEECLSSPMLRLGMTLLLARWKER